MHLLLKVVRLAVCFVMSEEAFIFNFLWILNYLYLDTIFRTKYYQLLNCETLIQLARSVTLAPKFYQQEYKVI